MKRRKMIVIISLMVVLGLLVTACGKKSFNEMAYDKAMPEATTSNDAKTSDMSYGSTAGAGADADYTGAYDVNEEEKAKDESGIDTGASLESQNNLNNALDKIIRRFYLDVETQEFDSLVTKLDSEIKRLGGYVENSKVSGKSYLYEHEARQGNIIARIPRDKVDEFISSVGENANVIDKQETTENVTLRYVDIESRKKTLEIEQERLFELLEKTDSLDNIIILENRLSEIRYELQSYSTELRTIDNEVDYSTVTLNVREVKRITPVAEVKQTVGDRIKNGFSESIYDISEGLKNFLVWFVVNLPYLIIWGVIILAIVLISRRIIRKSKLVNSLKQTNFTGMQQQGQAPMHQPMKDPNQDKQGGNKE